MRFTQPSARGFFTAPKNPTNAFNKIFLKLDVSNAFVGKWGPVKLQEFVVPAVFIMAFTKASTVSRLITPQNPAGALNGFLF
ncbi:MAG: hypothetical protein V3V74_07035 [Nitrosomonadaceae bacterium]